MPYAVNADLDAHIADILAAAASWAGVITAGIRSAAEIANARQQSCLEVLGAITTNPEHGYFGDLAALVTVAHNSFVPAHDGEIGTPKIVPFLGAAQRDGIPSDPDEIDSYRNDPASYTGAVDGIVTAHDQPTATRTEGAILTTEINQAGAGYEGGDTGTIAAGDGLATYEVLTVDAGGEVLTYRLNLRGSNYDVAEAVATITGGAQAGAGAGFTLDILTIGTSGTGRQSPLSCRFSIMSAYFKFTGLTAQIPMIIITTAMRDGKVPLRLGPAVVKRAIPKLVKPGDALYLIAGEFARDGKQDLVEIAGGAMSVRPVKAVPDIVAALKQN